MPRPRVLVVLPAYPSTVETYMHTEIEAVSEQFDVDLVALRTSTEPFREHLPYEVCAEPDAIRERIEDLRPDVLHTHWMHNAELLRTLAERTGVPFTLRAHSFDTLIERPRSLGQRLKRVSDAPQRLLQAVRAVQSDACIGVLALPCSERRLLKLGVPKARLHVTPPVVNVARFMDRRPNGDGVLNTGPCLPKKQMTDFIDAAAVIPERAFRLYAVGDRVEDIRAYNAAHGSPATLMPPIEPSLMPAEYKQAEWLFYTASPGIKTVGWSVSVAEAQASGVGVLVRNLRPDLRDYVGDAGYLYDTVDEAVEIMRRPFPADKRERGFELAKRCDVEAHIHVLTDLWPAPVPQGMAPRPGGR